MEFSFSKLVRWLFILVLALPGLAYGKEDPEFPVDLQSPVDAKGGQTWLEVLSQILIHPTVGKDGEATVDGLKSSGGPQPVCHIEASAHLNSVTGLNSGDRIFTLLNLDGCVLLAVFENAGAHKLVASLELSGIGGPLMGGETYDFESSFSLGKKTQLLWLSSDHENSDESFVNHQLLLAEGNRLKIVYDGPFLYSLKSGAKAAFFTAKIQALPAAPGGFPNFHIVARERKNYDSKKNLREYSWTISWDPRLQKYMGGSKALAQRMTALNPDLK